MATVSEVFTRVLNPAQFDAELHVSIPALFSKADTLPMAHYSLTPLGANQWRMEFPDTVPLADVRAAIANHSPTTTTHGQQQEAKNRAHWKDIQTEAPDALTRLEQIEHAPPSSAATPAALNALEASVRDMAHYQILVMEALGILAHDAEAPP